MSEEEKELPERAQQAARDPYSDDKREVLRYIVNIPVQFSTTEHLVEHLEKKRGMRQGEVAGILLEMKYEGLVWFQSVDEDTVLVHISESGVGRIE